MQTPKISKPEKKPTPIEVARSKRREIVELWADGHSFNEINKLLELGLERGVLRRVCIRDDDLSAMLQMNTDLRAHSLAEQSLEWAKEATMLGESSGYKVGIDTYMKTAARLLPKDYADVTKTELSGPGGKPLVIKADLTISPADAYERMVKGS